MYDTPSRPPAGTESRETEHEEIESEAESELVVPRRSNRQRVPNWKYD